MATTVTISDTATISDFANGVIGVAGYGTIWKIDFAGTWAVGDSFTLELVTASQTYDFGTGRVYGFVPVSAYTLQNRVHFVAGTYWFGSDNGDATAWEQQAPGAFKINVANQSQQNENLLDLSTFQGRMAIFSRNTTTIWSVNANPTLISWIQTISNMGTVSSQAVSSLGDFDVLFPSDTGVRSLRVLTLNLNGFITDIGAPVDADIQTAVQGQSLTQLSGICSVVEPTGKRYFVYMPSLNLVYVLSYFPTAKITAWSTYVPSFAASIPFSINSFRVFGSVVYFSGQATTPMSLPGNMTYFVGTYGTYDGSTTSQYDGCNPTVEFPWLDLKDPGLRKGAQGIDLVVQGGWTVSGSMDFDGVNTGGALQTIWNNGNPDNLNTNPPTANVYSSAQQGKIGFTDDGYNVLFKAVGTDQNNPSAIAKFSQLVFYYEPKGKK